MLRNCLTEEVSERNALALRLETSVPRSPVTFSSLLPSSLPSGQAQFQMKSSFFLARNCFAQKTSPFQPRGSHVGKESKKGRGAGLLSEEKQRGLLPRATGSEVFG